MKSLHRRDFLRCAACATAAVALPTPIRAWTRARPRADRRTLVLLHLEGGNDGLNTVIPYADPRYAALRPGLARRGAEVLKLDGKVGLHSNLEGLKSLFESDRAAILLGVGYPAPDLSHFRATEIWHSAEPDRSPSQGWIGRALDATPRELPLRAVSIGAEPPLVLSALTTPTTTVQSFSRFRVPDALASIDALYDRCASAPGTLGAAGRAGAAAVRAARKIATLTPSARDYGQAGELGSTLRKVAALAASDESPEVIACAFGGFDTHASQRGTHDQLLRQLGAGLAAFDADVRERGVDDRVLVVVYSEFGRRPAENASGGTDHGTACPIFVVGKRVRKNLYGEQPPLDDLDAGNLRHAVDFRRVYASLLKDWLGVDPRPVVGAFDPLPFLA